MPRRLLHIPKGLFKLAIFAVVLGAAIVIALIRTQGGRDFLGHQIESEFGKAFQGSLRIGRLYGNVARTFYATDVSIQDPDGRTVVHIDSLVLRLGLLDGLRQNITIRHAEFIRPRMHLVHDDSSGWNIQRALSLRKRESTSSTRWAFRSADVGIVDGSVVTLNTGTRPAIVDSLTIFDFTNARLDRFGASATIDWSDRVRLIDLRNLKTFVTSQNVEISEFRAQVAVTDSSIAINEAQLETAASRVSASLRLADLDSLGGLRDPNVRIPELALHVDEASVDSAELAAFFPKLQLPDMQVRLRATGSSVDLRVDDFFLQVGESRANAEARLTGWPDSLAFAVNVEDAIIQPQTVTHFFPTLRDMPAGSIEHTFQFAATGSARKGLSGKLDRLRSTIGFQITSDLGSANGEVGFARGIDDTLRFDGHLLLANYDAAAWISELGETRLNADLSFIGTGSSVAELVAAAKVRIRSSVIRGVAFDSLDVEAQAAGEQYAFDIGGHGRDGDFALAGRMDFDDPGARLDAVLQLKEFNALALSAGVPEPGASSISATMDIVAYGSAERGITGTVGAVVDTATFFVGRDTLTLSPSEHLISVHHTDSVHTVLELAGDVLEGRLEGRFTFEPLIQAASLWWGAAVHTVSQQVEKRLHNDDLLTAEDISAEAYSLEERRLRTHLLERGYDDGLDVQAELHIKRMRDLHQLYPSIPGASRFALLRGAAHLSADSLALSVSFEADSLRGDNLAVDDLSLEATLAGPYDYDLANMIDASVKIEAGILQSGSQRLEDLALDYTFSDGAGAIRVSSNDSAEGGLSVSLDASLTVLPDWNVLNLADLTVRKNNYIWSTHNETQLRLFGDGLGVDNLMVRSLHKIGDFDQPEQVFSVDGVISGDAADTLRLDARFIRLNEISDLGRFQFAIGGEMHASVTIAHVLREPRTAGDLSVSALTFDGRDLGDLRLRSVYSSPTEGIAVDLRLSQPREKTTGVQRYDAHIFGTVRPPSSEPDDHGSLNLTVEMPEIDMFFFEYLFPNELADVSGEGSGNGTITGDFSFPQFDASFDLDRSSFLVPEFNLRFGLSGPVTIDRTGFHLHNVSLTDPTGGIGTLRGDILTNEYKFFSFDIAADLAEIMIMNVSRAMDLSFYGQVWVSGSATLTGPLQQTLLRSVDAVTARKSRLYLPVTEDEIESDKTFIVFADSTGEFQIEKRGNILSKRPQTERAFVEGMDMSFNILIPEESSVFLVFDPLLGDIIHSLGSGRVQLQRREGDFQAFGTFTVESGDYLFTAGEVFQRRFILQSGGTITWDGDPIDARFDIPAVYRTRASLAGLPGQNPEDRVPIRVDMALTGRVTSPIVDLRIALDQDQRDPQVIPPGLESALNQADLAVEYATSVLLTNTFLLTSSQGSDALTNTADDLLFHSLSQLVSSQLNRFVSQALNLDVNVGVQQGRTQEEYDVIYGFALRLDDERVVIRGEGLYETGAAEATTSSGLQGAFVVEYRLTPSVQLEFFFRRESDLYRAASSLGTAYGVGIVYQTSFPNWHQFGRKLRGRKEPEVLPAPPTEVEVPAG